MNQKSIVLFYLLTALLSLLIAVVIYLLLAKSMSWETKMQKSQFVSLVGLPDLALVTETSSIRHRSLTDIFSLYRDDPSLREYFPSTFSYNITEVVTLPSSSRGELIER